MKKSNISIILLVIITIFVFGLHSLANYFIDTQYAVAATEQLESDSAYYAMETQKSLEAVVFYVFLVIKVSLIAIIIRKIFKKS